MNTTWLTTNSGRATASVVALFTSVNFLKVSQQRIFVLHNFQHIACVLLKNNLEKLSGHKKRQITNNKKSQFHWKIATAEEEETPITLFYDWHSRQTVKSWTGNCPCKIICASFFAIFHSDFTTMRLLFSKKTITFEAFEYSRGSAAGFWWIKKTDVGHYPEFQEDNLRKEKKGIVVEKSRQE